MGQSPMITRLSAAGSERIFDDEVGRFVEASVIPCHRCGVCCERWQPLVSGAEIERLAAFLGVGEAFLLERFTESYPLDDAVRLIRRQGGVCTFLRYDPDGRSSCSVHPARPEVCRSWTASLDRRECVEGLGRFGGSAELIPIHAVYSEQVERDRFAATVRGTEASDGD